MKRNHLYSIALVVIIALSLLRITYYFAYEKDGFHSDESWSYGFANSYYDPFIYSNSVDIFATGNDLKNFNEWVPGSVFKSYLQVDRGEAFEFGSVIYNKSGDMSPSLFEICLHFICSFFPETFSWWYAYIINALCFIGIMLLLYKLCNLVFDNPVVSLIIVAFYGFSLGAFNTIMYLRMYAMLTFFSVLTVYLFQKINLQDRECLWINFALVLTVFLGSFTHFYYLLFAFFLTLLYCISMLIKKRVKKCFLTGSTMLIGVIAYFAIYPAAIGMILGSDSMYDNTVSYNYRISLEILLRNFFNSTFKADKLVNAFLYLDIIAGAVFVAIIVFLLLFLMRKESWFPKVMNVLKSFAKYLRKQISGFLSYVFGQKCIVVFGTFISVFASAMVVARISNVAAMGAYCDRYIFNLYPLLIASVIVMLAYFTGLCNWRRTVYSVILLLGLAASLFFQNRYIGLSQYLFKSEIRSLELTEMLSDSDVIILSEATWRLEWYSVFLQDVNRALICKKSDLAGNADKLSDISGDKKVYVVIEQAYENNYVNVDIDKIDPDTINALAEINSLYSEAVLVCEQEYFTGIHIYSIN